MEKILFQADSSWNGVIFTGGIFLFIGIIFGLNLLNVVLGFIVVSINIYYVNSRKYILYEDRLVCEGVANKHIIGLRQINNIQQNTSILAETELLFTLANQNIAVRFLKKSDADVIQKLIFGKIKNKNLKKRKECSAQKTIPFSLISDNKKNIVFRETPDETTLRYSIIIVSILLIIFLLFGKRGFGY